MIPLAIARPSINFETVEILLPDSDQASGGVEDERPVVLRLWAAVLRSLRTTQFSSTSGKAILATFGRATCLAAAYTG
jgi:hypothetical protein